VGADNGEKQAPEGDQAKPTGSPAAPALPPVDPSKAKRKRPAWADLPGRKHKTLMEGNADATLFEWHLKGDAVDDQGVRPQFLAEFLEAFRKLFEPLQVVPTGFIPEGNVLPKSNAASTRVAALAQTGSVTIAFSLGPEELSLGEYRGENLAGLQTVKATGHLGALLSFEANEDLLRSVKPYGKRIGRSYGQLAELLADNNVEADWWSDTYSSKPIEVTAPEARDIADRLIRTPLSETEKYKVGGVLWDAATGDAKQRFVRIATPSREIKASYDIPLTTTVTKALSHEVEAEIQETAYKYPFAEKAHRREFTLLKLIGVGASAGALAEWEQLQLGQP
jgi:hypothetical protein